MALRVRRALSAVSLICLLLGPSSGARAATFCVSNAAELTSAMLTARNNGVDDVIHLVQGNYVGSFIHDANNSLTIEGGYTGGCGSRVVNAANTVLNANTTGQTLRLYATAAVTYVVDGVTIQGGRALSMSDPSTMNGGGLWVPTQNGNVVVTNTVVTGNAAYQDGGGVYIIGANSVLVRNSTISGNNSGFGAGFYAVDTNSVTLDSNTISGNAASFSGGGGDGGGVYVDTTHPNTGGTGSTVVTLSTNTIANNSAVATGGGIFIFGDLDGSTTATVRLTGNVVDNNGSLGGAGFATAYLTSLNMTANTFKNNHATGGGGAIALYSAQSVTLASNVIHNNSASDGGGVYWFDSTPAVDSEALVATNNTIANNSATSFGGGIWIQLTDDGDAASLYDNIIMSNTAGSGSGGDLIVGRDGNTNAVYSVFNLLNNDFNQSPSGFFIGPGSFTIDGSNRNNVNPMFVNAGSGDYRLQASSTLIDGGLNSAPGLPRTDRIPAFRFAGPAVDIGAYEFGALALHKRRIVDFDGDGMADITVYHSATGLWYIRQSSTAATTSVGFGGSGYAPVPGDYDGDGKTDVAVYHAASGSWFIQNSSTGMVFSLAYGGTDYTPVAGDYDGDGKTDIAVYHAASGLWFIRQSSTSTTLTVGFGGTGYFPVPEDYDGDARTDVAVFHPGSGLWFVQQSGTGTTLTVGYGGTGYTTVPLDYDGDGRADIAVFHPSTGLWFVRQTTTGTTLTIGYGGSSYTPVPDYYDDDGRGDVAVYHPATGLWFVRQSSTGTTYSLGFGGPGFTPVN